MISLNNLVNRAMINHQVVYKMKWPFPTPKFVPPKWLILIIFFPVSFTMCDEFPYWIWSSDVEKPVLAFFLENQLNRKDGGGVIFSVIT